MSKLTVTGACALLALAALVVGCGGGDDNPSKAEFIKQGNAICKKGNQTIDKAAKQTFTSKQRPSTAEIKKFATESVIPNVQTQVDDIRDLGAPSGDEDKVNAILDEAQSAIDETKADPALFASNKDPFAKANKLARQYGLTVCGS